MVAALALVLQTNIVCKYQGQKQGAKQVLHSSDVNSQTSQTLKIMRGASRVFTGKQIQRQLYRLLLVGFCFIIILHRFCEQ